MSIFIYEYNLKTHKFKKKVVNEEITEEDLLISNLMGLQLFSTYEEMIQFHEKHQVTSSNENNIIYNKDTEDATSMKQDTSDKITNIKKYEEETENITWGGYRVGSGRKKGPQGPRSQETKDKIRQSMKGKRNAARS